MSRLPAAFQQLIVSIPIQNINPRTEISSDTRKSTPYSQIAASIREIGIIEPLVVYPRAAGDYLLLDGHLRLEILKSLGFKEVRCILSTDDEAYTYNRRVNSIPPIAQHLMLLEALRSGLTEERIAASLKVDVSVIRQKRDMLKGICPEAVELLRDRKVNAQVFNYLRKMKPFRQIEVAEHMIANSTYSLTFVKALLYATRPELLIQAPKANNGSAATDGGRSRLVQESEQLLKDLKALEETYGRNVLTLTVCQGYINRLLKNPRVARYLDRKHKETYGAMLLWSGQKKLTVDEAGSTIT
jgi:hypothetical protein